MFYIQQSHIYGCGFACLKMVLANIRNDERYLYLPEKSEKPMSYKQLIASAKQQGLHLCGFKVDNKEEILRNTIFPMIVTITPKEGENHAIIITKIRGKRVYILDPASDRRSMSLKEFYTLWDSTGLLIEKDEGGGFLYEIVEPDKNKDYLWTTILQVCSGLFCILGVYFINSNGNILFPIILLSLFIISELILKNMLFKGMEKTDAYFTSNLNLKKGQYSQYFKNLERYKELSVVNPVSFATNLTVCVFIAFIVVLNSPWNIALVFGVLAIALFDVFIINPRNRQKELDIEIDEQQLDDSQSNEEFASNLKRIHMKAYSLGRKIIGKRYIYIFLMLIIAILMTIATNTFAFPQIIFYCCIEYCLYEYSVKLLSFSENKKQFNVARAKLVSSIHQNDENI